MRVFNTTIKTIGETYEEYIINAFSYTLKNMALNWYNNYMLEFPNYSFYELT